MGKKQIYKIVITGGPCAGKTTALKYIREAFEQRGYTPIFCPETATELISGGVAPWTCTTNVEYQHCQLGLQHAKEQIFWEAANHMPPEKMVIIFDRGFLDNKVYMTDEEFTGLLKEMSFSEDKTRNWYDGVFHLETAAKGDADAYTLSNNGARYETATQACELDDKLIKAWDGHPYHRIIGHKYDFEDKMKHLIRELNLFIDEMEKNMK